MSTPIFIAATIFVGPNSGPVLLQFVDALPLAAKENQVVNLEVAQGPFQPGMYVRFDQAWHYVMPIEAVSAIIVGGDETRIYIKQLQPVNLPANAVVYRNGQMLPDQTILPSDIDAYGVRMAGSAISGVSSVNGMTGAVILDATNLPLLQPVAVSGLYSDLLDGYVLPAATALDLGGVRVPQTSRLTVDPLGNIDIAPAVLAQLDGKLATLTNIGSGQVLIDSQSAPNANVRSLVPGNNIQITPDGAGGLVIASTGGSLTGITLLNDVTGVSDQDGDITATLALVGTAGQYTLVTTDSKGRVIAGSKPTTLVGLGIVEQFLPLIGGSMLGDIAMATNKIKGLNDPLTNDEAANKGYVDATVAAIASGVFWKESVRAASVANLTLSGPQTVDGIALVAGDRVLVMNQTDAKQNGIYVVAAGAWARATDATTGAQLFHAAVLIISGTAHGLEQWVNTNTTTPVVGTDNITWGQLKGAANAYVAGTGLQLTGLTFSIAPVVTAGQYVKVTVNAQGQVVAGSALNAADVNNALGYTAYDGDANPKNFIAGLTMTGDGTGTANSSGVLNMVLAASGVTAGTYTKVTVDAKGRVTVGGTLSQAEIAAALGYTPVNKAGDSMLGALNESATSNVTAVAETNIGAVNATTLNVNGSATITSLGTSPAGTYRRLIFAAVSTLVNSAGLILPGAANLNTAPGDVGEFLSTAPGTWRCVAYTKANGQAVVVGGGSDPTKLPLAGGTMTGAINETTPLSLSVSTTTPIGATNANTITVNGSGTVTGFDVWPSGAIRNLLIAGAFTLQYNAVSLILPGAANIVTAVGDSASFISMGGGNWRCLNYTRGSGQALIASGLPLAGGTMIGAINEAAPVPLTAAATLNIGAANSNIITVIGSTAITGFDAMPVQGARRTLVFQNILTLTYNATSLILPSEQNIVTAAGDVAEFVNIGGANWRCLSYTRSNGQPVVGGGSPYSTTQIFNGSATDEAACFANVVELAALISAVPAATEVFNVSAGAVQLHTVNATANWVLNVRHSATTALNAAMNVGDSLTIALLVNQGTTAFYQTGLQIDGAGVTVKWQGGVQPSGGNASSLDTYTFTIIKTAAASYTVLGALTQFK